MIKFLFVFKAGLGVTYFETTIRTDVYFYYHHQ